MRVNLTKYLVILSGLIIFSGCMPTSQYDESGNEIIETRYLHQYGIAMPVDEWQQSGQNGQIIHTLRQGIKCTQNYHKGMLDGETTYTFPFSDDLEKVQVYSNNQLKKETTYHRNGPPSREIIFFDGGHEVREWFETGSQKSIETIENQQIAKGCYFDVKQQCVSCIENGNGTKTLTDSYGQLLSTEHYQRGEVFQQVTYHSNGNPKEIIPLRNGIVDGSLKTFYPGGEPKTIETWKEGKQEGLTTVYEDAMKVEEIFYVDGKKNGISKMFKDGIIVSQETTWKDGYRHGPTYTYLEDKVTTDWYLKDNKVSKGYFEAINLRP